MERRTARREAELRRVLEESRQHSRIELSRLQALHADEMRAKDALIHGFREELDSLLRAAGQFMRTASSGVDGGVREEGPGGQRGGVRDGAGAGVEEGAGPLLGVVS